MKLSVLNTTILGLLHFTTSPAFSYASVISKYHCSSEDFATTKGEGWSFEAAFFAEFKIEDTDDKPYVTFSKKGGNGTTITLSDKIPENNVTVFGTWEWSVLFFGDWAKVDPELRFLSSRLNGEDMFLTKGRCFVVSEDGLSNKPSEE